MGFRTFHKDAYRLVDDLFDAAMYAVLASLGDGTEAALVAAQADRLINEGQENEEIAFRPPLSRINCDGR
jgi:hypothetical protein